MIPNPLTAPELAKLAGVKLGENLVSLHEGLKIYGQEAGLVRPHRLIQYLAQTGHESQGYHYDREVWGPTPAQARYDTRTDLGNTPQKDGDGYKYRGRTGIQITGLNNTRAFRDWCRAWIDKNCPDFVLNPDLMNTNPWEGLGPIWFWHTNNVNRLADVGNFEGVTQRINGGFNGHMDRMHRYGQIGFRALGYHTTNGGVIRFQTEHGLVRDGVIGPKTRLRIHELLKQAPNVTFVSAPPKAAEPEEHPFVAWLKDAFPFFFNVSL